MNEVPEAILCPQPTGKRERRTQPKGKDCGKSLRIEELPMVDAPNHRKRQQRSSIAQYQ